MALMEGDFREGIERLARAWRETKGERGVGSWEDVDVLESFGTRYLRITKQLLTSEPEGESKCDAQDEPVIEEDDPEALVTTPRTQSPSTRAVHHDIVHSPSYQVPVLYITFCDRSTKKSLPLPSPDEMYGTLVPSEFNGPLRDVGIMGALSMAEHPINGTPAYFVHPCRTQEVMAPLLQGCKLPKDGQSVGYLMLWIGTIGSSVGLSIPVEVARTLADGRGSSA